MAWLFSGGGGGDIQKLEKIIALSSAANKHKRNYNAAAVLLVKTIKPKVNSGAIQGNQKTRFRALYNKFGPVVNESAVSSFAQKIINDPNLMKRYFNRQNQLSGGKNMNFNKKLRKLESIIFLASKYNKHKKNYNAAAMVLMRNLQPRVNSGAIKGSQRNNFLSVHRRFAPIVNMTTASSPYAAKIINNPYMMKQYFNRQNRATPAPLPAPNVRPRNTRSRASSVNVRPRNVRSRASSVGLSSWSGSTSRSGNKKTCVFKKLGLFGQPVCK
jgi:hypothetical protein